MIDEKKQKIEAKPGSFYKVPKICNKSIILYVFCFKTIIFRFTCLKKNCVHEVELSEVIPSIVKTLKQVLFANITDFKVD